MKRIINVTKYNEATGKLHCTWEGRPGCVSFILHHFSLVFMSYLTLISPSYQTPLLVELIDKHIYAYIISSS